VCMYFSVDSCVLHIELLHTYIVNKSEPSVKFAHHFQLDLRLRVYGSIPTLHCTFSWRSQSLTIETALRLPRA
jgi:hypothetical protein